jgi:hypothetical protein
MSASTAVDNAMNVQEKVQVLQTKLSRVAKQSLGRRFGALYDKIYRRDVLMVAWKRCRDSLKMSPFNSLEMSP